MASSAEVTPYIVNGTDTSVSVYPSYASIVTYIDYDDSSYQVGARCGATIIDSTYILTAAHCVASTDVSEVLRLFTIVLPQFNNELDFNSISEFENTTKYWVSDIYVHESYDSDNIENDIAILKLETPLSVPSSAYAQFVSNESSYRGGVSEVYTAVGHGNTQTGVDATPVLQKADLSIVANGSCGYAVGGAPATQLCMEGAVVSGLEKATCQGDSGGPLYWTSGTTYQVGITSYGPATNYGCGSTTFPGATSVFTEVVDYITWINAVKNGQKTADYSPAESDRDYYRQNKVLPSDTPVIIGSSGGSSSGGAVSVWGMLMLLITAWLPRKWFNYKQKL